MGEGGPGLSEAGYIRPMMGEFVIPRPVAYFVRKGAAD
jgi:hypothetical protein